MKEKSPPNIALILAVGIGLAGVWRLGAETAAIARFENEIRPLLERHCTRCHGAEKQKGNLNLDRLSPDLVNGHDADHWQEVLDRLNLGEMPPEDEPQPTREEKLALIDWLTGQMQLAIQQRRSNGGRTVVRRMTRYEYDYTMRDLLGVDFNYADGLPPEGASAAGFRNDGRVLAMSPLQVEVMLKNTLRAMEKVILSGPPPTHYDYHIEVEKHQPEFRPSTPEEQAMFPDFARQASTSYKYEKDRVQTSGVSLHPFFKKKSNIPQELFGEVAVSRKYPDYLQLDMERFTFPGQANMILNKVTMVRVDIRDFPREGDVELEIGAAAVPGADGRHPRLLVELGFWGSMASKPRKPILDVEVRGTPDKPETFKARARIENFPLPSLKKPRVPELWMLIWNMASVPHGGIKGRTLERALEEALPLRAKEPKLLVDYVKFRGPVLDGWPPAYHRAILFDGDRSDESAYVREVLRRFLSRAYRRPATTQEIEQMQALYAELRPEHPSLETAMRKVLATILCSPKFLYLVEPTPESSDRPTRRRLNDYELANRLSYFLWCSMPDRELLALAEQERLNDPGTLKRQVIRLLDDPRSDRFARHFSEQWLKLDGLVQVAVNPEFYPDWDDSLKDDMREETQRFIAHAFRENLPCQDLLGGGFTILNERLAAHYGIPGVVGHEFQRVDLKPGYRRGSGLLGHAGILLANSDGEHSHPIKRGVWILDRLLASPPPEPPPGVPGLEQGNSDIASLPLKEQLERHRNEVSCAHCHAKLDPWGVALEHYDAVGRWREVVRLRNVIPVVDSGDDKLRKKKRPAKATWSEQPVDARSKLPDGAWLNGLKGLERALIHRRGEDFAGGVAKRLTAYAFGRTLDLADRPEIESLLKTWKSRDYRLRDLIQAIVASESFQTK